MAKEGPGEFPSLFSQHTMLDSHRPLGYFGLYTCLNPPEGSKVAYVPTVRNVYFFMPMQSESWLNNCQTVSGVRYSRWQQGYPQTVCIHKGVTDVSPKFQR